MNGDLDLGPMHRLLWNRLERKIAMSFSIVGSLLVALNIPQYSLVAFVLWCVSNFIWIIDAVRRHDKEHTAQYFWFLITSVVGIYTSLKLLDW